VFLTKKFKEGTNITFLEFYLNAMIRNIKIKNIFDIVEIQNLWNLINVLIKKIMKIFI